MNSSFIGISMFNGKPCLCFSINLKNKFEQWTHLEQLCTYFILDVGQSAKKFLSRNLPVSQKVIETVT